MLGLGPNYLGLSLPLAVLVVWYCAFGRGRRFSLVALVVLLWMLGWTIFATSNRGIF